MASESFEFDQRGDFDLENAVGQAIGAASMCWEDLSGAGVFDSTRAKEIADALIDYIRGTNRDGHARLRAGVPAGPGVGRPGGVMARFRKKPVEIEATRWVSNGDHPDDRVGEWLTDPVSGEPYQRLEGAVVRFFRRPDVPGDTRCRHCGVAFHFHGWIDTLEGGHTVCPGDWIITGVKGERYPCKPDIFEATYELVA